MLSFSTNGSAKHPFTDKVREATQMVRYKRPELICDGEMQVDAALVPSVSAYKFPKSLIKGDANVLIFPDLQSGNLALQLLQKLGDAIAVGPVLLGTRLPVHVIHGNNLDRAIAVDGQGRIGRPKVDAKYWLHVPTPPAPPRGAGLS